jgi:hypothetical protein
MCCCKAELPTDCLLTPPRSGWSGGRGPIWMNPNTRPSHKERPCNKTRVIIHVLPHERIPYGTVLVANLSIAALSVLSSARSASPAASRALTASSVCSRCCRIPLLPHRHFPQAWLACRIALRGRSPWRSARAAAGGAGQARRQGLPDRGRPPPGDSSPTQRSPLPPQSPRSSAYMLRSGQGSAVCRCPRLSRWHSCAARVSPRTKDSALAAHNKCPRARVREGAPGCVEGRNPRRSRCSA